jgi:hypothetical protein
MVNLKLYPLVSYAPKHIREAAYELLVVYIQRQKEKIEIEAALSRSEANNVAALPEELLSLIVDTDFLDDTEDINGESARRQSLEGYLMSWSLIFQRFIDSVPLLTFASSLKVI